MNDFASEKAQLIQIKHDFENVLKKHTDKSLWDKIKSMASNNEVANNIDLLMTSKNQTISELN